MISLLAFADFEGDVGGDLEGGERGGDGVEHGGVILPIRRFEATRS